MPTITIRIEESMRDRLNEAADERGVTTSTYVRDALEEIFRLENREGYQERAKAEYELSPVERKMLIMLHRITLATQGDLDEEYYDRKEEEQQIDALSYGFTSEYANEVFAGVYEPMPQSEGELVWEILDMFRVIAGSVHELGKDGWNQLSLEDAERYGTFQGFDLNDARESRMLSYVRHLVKTDRYKEQKEFVLGAKGPRGNSHRLMLSRYRDMLRVFKPIWAEKMRGFSWHLTATELRRVLIAGGATAEREAL
ncbi:hypothetical protein D3C74_232130 [compost metagenome]